MSQFNTKITEAIEALDAEIADVEQELEQLKATRANLETVLVEGDDETPKKSQRSKVSTIKVSDKPQRSGRADSKRGEIISMLEDGVKPSIIAEQMDVTPNYVYTIRKAEAIAQSDTPRRGGRRASRNSDSGNGARKVTKRQQIADMLADKMSVKDIADELGISPSYVYNVKGSL
jgi:DNA-binding CsgD family transcriptional regulator